MRGWLVVALSILGPGCGGPELGSVVDVPALAAPPMPKTASWLPPPPPRVLAPTTLVSPVSDGALALDCHRTDVDVKLSLCSGRWRYIWQWKAEPASEACRDGFTVGTSWYPTQAAALSAEGCSTACVYRAASAALFVHCGQKDEEMQWSAGGDCPDVYVYSDGSFWTDPAGWEKAHPCP